MPFSIFYSNFYSETPVLVLVLVPIFMASSKVEVGAGPTGKAKMAQLLNSLDSVIFLARTAQSSA